VHTSNPLAVDLAHFVAADVLVMTASALSSLAAFLRGARTDFYGDRGGGGFAVTDVRNDHLPQVPFSARDTTRLVAPQWPPSSSARVFRFDCAHPSFLFSQVQFPGDPISAHPDPAFYHGWNASVGFVASDDEASGPEAFGPEAFGSAGSRRGSRLRHAPRCALFAAPSPPRPVCAAPEAATAQSPHAHAAAAHPASPAGLGTAERHAAFAAAATAAAAQASKAAAARRRSQSAVAGAAQSHAAAAQSRAAHQPAGGQVASAASAAAAAAASVAASAAVSLHPARNGTRAAAGVQHRPARPAPRLVEAFLEKGHLPPPRPPVAGMQGKHMKHPLGLFGR
jgi:hypothetical protein